MSYLTEWQVEDVVQNIGKSFSRLEPVKDDKHRNSNGVSKLHFTFGVNAVLARKQPKILGVDWLFSA
jgi:hypothetical protein